MCDQFAHCVVLSCPVGSAYEMDCLKVMHRFDLLRTTCDSLDMSSAQTAKPTHASQAVRITTHDVTRTHLDDYARRRRRVAQASA
jgi:hypothetical protein